MDLIKCVECSEKISRKAKSCPHCGFTESISWQHNIIYIILGVIIILTLLYIKVLDSSVLITYLDGKEIDPSRSMKIRDFFELEHGINSALSATESFVAWYVTLLGFWIGYFMDYLFFSTIISIAIYLFFDDLGEKINFVTLTIWMWFIATIIKCWTFFSFSTLLEMIFN